MYTVRLVKPTTKDIYVVQQKLKTVVQVKLLQIIELYRFHQNYQKFGYQSKCLPSVLNLHNTTAAIIKGALHLQYDKRLFYDFIYNNLRKDCYNSIFVTYISE